MPRTILVVLSECRYWGEELLGELAGKRSHALQASLDLQADRPDSPHSPAGWLPERSFVTEPGFLPQRATLLPAKKVRMRTCDDLWLKSRSLSC